MRVDFHRNFDKSFPRLTKKQKEQFEARLQEFAEDQFNPLLNNHGLRGAFAGYRSINISGDIRAIFFVHSKNHVEFVEIGAHSKLYR